MEETEACEQKRVEDHFHVCKSRKRKKRPGNKEAEGELSIDRTGLSQIPGAVVFSRMIAWSVIGFFWYVHE